MQADGETSTRDVVYETERVVSCLGQEEANIIIIIVIICNVINTLKSS